MRPKTIFEVGDRVMALEDGWREQKGDVGTVIGFLDEHQSNVSVDWDAVCDGTMVRVIIHVQGPLGAQDIVLML